MINLYKKSNFEILMFDIKMIFKTFVVCFKGEGIKKFNFYNYQNLLKQILNLNIKFSNFEEPTANSVILRHDVDYDLEWAEMIANANKKLNIQACFFILISSANYNIFEDENILL